MHTSRRHKIGQGKSIMHASYYSVTFIVSKKETQKMKTHRDSTRKSQDI